MVKPPFVTCPICLIELGYVYHDKSEQVSWVECSNVYCPMQFIDWWETENKWVYQLYTFKASYPLAGFDGTVVNTHIEDVMKWLK